MNKRYCHTDITIYDTIYFGTTFKLQPNVFKKTFLIFKHLRSFDSSLTTLITYRNQPSVRPIVSKDLIVSTT